MIFALYISGLKAPMGLVPDLYTLDGHCLCHCGGRMDIVMKQYAPAAGSPTLLCKYGYSPPYDYEPMPTSTFEGCGCPCQSSGYETEHLPSPTPTLSGYEGSVCLCTND
jgi:hypothetical protein